MFNSDVRFSIRSIEADHHDTLSEPPKTGPARRAARPRSAGDRQHGLGNSRLAASSQGVNYGNSHHQPGRVPRRAWPAYWATPLLSPLLVRPVITLASLISSDEIFIN